MILHLFDDEKIVDRAIECFEEALPYSNRIIVFLKSEFPRFVKTQEGVEFYRVGDSVGIDLTNIKKVIIHFLDFNKISFCLKFIPKYIPIYWVIWGGDLYNQFLDLKGYKLYDTIRFIPTTTNIKRLLGRCGYIPQKEKLMLSFLKERVRGCLVMCEEEYGYLTKYFSNQTENLERIPFFYNNIEQLIPESLRDKWVAGNTILAGNSASLTNNHKSTFKILSRCISDSCQVVVPLSYGGTERYKKFVVKEGHKYLGNRFLPLEQYMPLDEYNQYLLSSEIAVFGSWRQEAVGNIIVALYLGAKVFVSYRSPLLSWFGNMGVHIFELEKMTPKQFKPPLTMDQKYENRQIIKEIYNKKNLISLIQNAFIS